MIKTTLLTLLGLVVLAIAVVAALASQRPDTFRVSRSTSIAAPAEKIFPLVNDVHAFNSWNPYAQKDPEMKGSYSGPSAGPGAHYDFESRKAGSGSFEIVQTSAPSQLKMRLVMTAPFKADTLNQPADVLAVTCDVSDRAQVQSASEKVQAAFGRVDALVNNAGVAIFKPVMDTTFEEWRHVMATNLDGAISLYAGFCSADAKDGWRQHRQHCLHLRSAGQHAARCLRHEQGGAYSPHQAASC